MASIVFEDLISLKEKGNNFFREKNFQKALEIYKKCDEYATHGTIHAQEGLKKQSSQLKILKCSIKTNLGITYINLREFKKAIHVLNEGLEIDPHNWKAYYRLSVCWEEFNEYGKALKNLKRILSIPNLQKKFKQIAMQSIKRVVSIFVKEREKPLISSDGFEKIPFHVRIEIFQWVGFEFSLVVENELLLNAFLEPKRSNYGYSGRIAPIYGIQGNIFREATDQIPQSKKISFVIRKIYGFFKEDRFRKVYLLINTMKLDVLMNKNSKCNFLRFVPKGRRMGGVMCVVGMSMGQNTDYPLSERREDEKPIICEKLRIRLPIRLESQGLLSPTQVLFSHFPAKHIKLLDVVSLLKIAQLRGNNISSDSPFSTLKELTVKVPKGCSIEVENKILENIRKLIGYGNLENIKIEPGKSESSKNYDYVSNVQVGDQTYVTFNKPKNGLEKRTPFVEMLCKIPNSTIKFVGFVGRLQPDRIGLILEFLNEHFTGLEKLYLPNVGKLDDLNTFLSNTKIRELIMIVQNLTPENSSSKYQFSFKNQSIKRLVYRIAADKAIDQRFCDMLELMKGVEVLQFEELVPPSHLIPNGVLCNVNRMKRLRKFVLSTKASFFDHEDMSFQDGYSPLFLCEPKICEALGRNETIEELESESWMPLNVSELKNMKNLRSVSFGYLFVEITEITHREYIDFLDTRSVFCAIQEQVCVFLREAPVLKYVVFRGFNFSRDPSITKEEIVRITEGCIHRFVVACEMSKTIETLIINGKKYELKKIKN